MQILVYKGKHGELYFNASGPCVKAWAFLALFKHIDDMGYYGRDWIPSYEWQLVESARNGDKTAAYHLLLRRRKHEYECWTLEPLIEP